MIKLLPLWFTSVLFIIASICEMSFGYMDPEGIWAKLTFQQFNWEYYEYDWIIALGEISLSTILLFVAHKINSKLNDKFLELAFRLGLGLMFIIASWHKVTQPYEFANLIAQYQFLPSFMVNLFALILAPFELMVGILLILGPYSKWNARLILIMMLMFIVAISQALIRDLGITCGCFAIEGAQDKKGAYVTLVRDIILLAPILWLVFKARSKAWIWEKF